MIPISQAIRNGMHQDPLSAALLYIRGDIPHPGIALRALYHAWPHLGQTVRSWPGLAAELERCALLPEVRKYQLTYRREIHMSQWNAITDLHDKQCGSCEQIAVILQGAGL